MANAKENSWPLLVIGGSSDTDQENYGAFQVYVLILKTNHILLSCILSYNKIDLYYDILYTYTTIYKYIYIYTS